ncbi:N-acetylmuramoyl-L-alanine amidase [Parasphingorhabdus pacifica]
MRKNVAATLAAGTMVLGVGLCTPGLAHAESSGPGIPDPPTATSQQLTAETDYPDANWVPAHTSNFTGADRPGTNTIDKVVIHVTQGSYDGSLAWFQNPDAQVSAHYTVRSSDGQVAQSVRENDIAWHAGNWTYNQTSVGIEHEGWVDEPEWFTDEMYESSAQLTADIANRYDIPLDRDHIIGHNEVPGATHTDPGSNWDWDEYMSLVRSYATN